MEAAARQQDVAEAATAAAEAAAAAAAEAAEAAQRLARNRKAVTYLDHQVSQKQRRALADKLADCEVGPPIMHCLFPVPAPALPPPPMYALGPPVRQPRSW